MFTRTRERLVAGAGTVGSLLSSPLPVDPYVRLVAPLWSRPGTRTIPARVDDIVPESARAVTLVLTPGAGWHPHRPGQWLGLGVDIDGVRHHRCYSITSLPGADQVTVTVQAVPGGLVSNHVARELRPDTVVHLDQPAGEFTLPDPVERPLLFVTGGSGITPVMGMLRWLAASVRLDDAVLLHHAPGPADVLFAAELDALAARFPGLDVQVAITGPGVPAPEHQLTIDRLDAACPDWRARDAWVCGPSPLLDAADAAWAAPGADGARLRTERFRPATSLPAAGGAGGRVHFARSGIEVAADGGTPLLEVAEEAGLRPASGCRMGICHTCVTRLSSGCVANLRDGRLQAEEGDLVQLCVSAAAGTVVLDL